MDSIFYIFRKTVKNAVIDAFRHPLMLLMYGIFFLSIISAVLMGYFNSTATYTVEKDTRALYGGYLALLHFIRKSDTCFSLTAQALIAALRLPAGLPLYRGR